MINAQNYWNPLFLFLWDNFQPIRKDLSYNIEIHLSIVGRIKKVVEAAGFFLILDWERARERVKHSWNGTFIEKRQFYVRIELGVISRLVSLVAAIFSFLFSYFEEAQEFLSQFWTGIELKKESGIEDTFKLIQDKEVPYIKSFECRDWKSAIKQCPQLFNCAPKDIQNAFPKQVREFDFIKYAIEMGPSFKKTYGLSVIRFKKEDTECSEDIRFFPEAKTKMSRGVFLESDEALWDYDTQVRVNKCKCQCVFSLDQYPQVYDVFQYLKGQRGILQKNLTIDANREQVVVVPEGYAFSFSEKAQLKEVLGKATEREVLMISLDLLYGVSCLEKSPWEYPKNLTELVRIRKDTEGLRACFDISFEKKENMAHIYPAQYELVSRAIEIIYTIYQGAGFTFPVFLKEGFYKSCGSIAGMLFMNQEQMQTLSTIARTPNRKDTARSTYEEFAVSYKDRLINPSKNISELIQSLELELDNLPVDLT